MLDISGPLPQYHPKFLFLLILTGNFAAFNSILGQFASWLEMNLERTSSLTTQESLDCLPLFSPKSFDSSRGSKDLQVDIPAADILVPRVELSSFVQDEVSDLPRRINEHGRSSASDSDPDMRMKGSDDDSRMASGVNVPSASAQETGMLDMAAFGMGATPTTTAHHNAAKETGMLDMAAFGMGATPTTTAHHNAAKETGMLDMAAFGTVPSNPSQLYPTSSSVTTSGQAKVIRMKVNDNVSSETLRALKANLSSVLGLLRKIVGSATETDISMSSFYNVSNPVPGLGSKDSGLLLTVLEELEGSLSKLQQPLDAPALIFLMLIGGLNHVVEKSASSDINAELKKKSLRRLQSSKSMKNAAGVEYTLAPSLVSKAEEESSELTTQSLRDKLSLASNVSILSLFWLCLSTSSQELVDLAQDLVQIPVQTQKDSTSSLDSFSSTPYSSDTCRKNWKFLRSIGAGFWLKDDGMMRLVLEEAAKVEFRETKSPDNVAFIYMIIGKLSILRGLYRTSNKMKEAEFLSKDFSQQHNQDAACKNAFVLLSQHRFTLASAFFLLGAHDKNLQWEFLVVISHSVLMYRFTYLQGER